MKDLHVWYSKHIESETMQKVLYFNPSRFFSFHRTWLNNKNILFITKQCLDRWILKLWLTDWAQGKLWRVATLSSDLIQDSNVYICSEVVEYGSQRLKLSPSRGEAGEKLQCHSDIPIGTERYFDWTLTEDNICESLNWRGREKVGAFLWSVLFCNYGWKVIWFLLCCWTKLSVSMQRLQLKDYRLVNKSCFNDSIVNFMSRVN